MELEAVDKSTGSSAKKRNGKNSGTGNGTKPNSRDIIIKALRKDGKTTTRMLTEMLGISDTAVEKHLAKLKAEGLLTRVGPDKGGYWEVSPKARTSRKANVRKPAQAPAPMPVPRQMEIIFGNDEETIDLKQESIPQVENAPQLENAMPPAIIADETFPEISVSSEENSEIKLRHETALPPLRSTIDQAIESRHSVRAYKDTPLSDTIINTLNARIAEVNAAGDLNIQLVTGEPKAFLGIIARYGKFKGVTNYLVMAGRKSDDLDERVGYYGEQLVLLAQTLGLNTCWVGISYSKISGTYTLRDKDKIACYIALGYGETQGTGHSIKTMKEVSNVNETSPYWFRRGLRAALFAPTAVNQQKFYFEYVDCGPYRKAKVIAKKKFSLIGFTQMDLGIAKLHFEIGAGKDNFEWAR